MPGDSQRAERSDKPHKYHAADIHVYSAQRRGNTDFYHAPDDIAVESEPFKRGIAGASGR